MDRKRALVAVIATALAAMAGLVVLAMPAASVRAKRRHSVCGSHTDVSSHPAPPDHWYQPGASGLITQPEGQ